MCKIILMSMLPPLPSASASALPGTIISTDSSTSPSTSRWLWPCPGLSPFNIYFSSTSGFWGAATTGISFHYICFLLLSWFMCRISEKKKILFRPTFPIERRNKRSIIHGYVKAAVRGCPCPYSLFKTILLTSFLSLLSIYFPSFTSSLVCFIIFFFALQHSL